MAKVQISTLPLTRFATQLKLLSFSFLLKVEIVTVAETSDGFVTVKRDTLYNALGMASDTWSIKHYMSVCCHYYDSIVCNSRILATSQGPINKELFS